MVSKAKRAAAAVKVSEGGSEGGSLSRNAIAFASGALLVSMVGYSMVLQPQPPSAQASHALLMPMSNASASHQRKWAQQVLEHARRRGAGAQHVISDDGRALMSTPAGHAQQINMLRQRAGGHKTIPVVVSQDPIKGVGVFYAGTKTLPKGTVVGAWQTLVVREDLVDEWIDSGKLANTSDVQTFWETYSIEYKYEDDEYTGRWFAFPVGAQPGLPWHNYGALDDAQTDAAVYAFNNRTLPDWTTGVMQQEKGTDVVQLLPFVGHLMNEPSGDEPRTMGPMSGQKACSFVGEDVRVCGGILEASTMIDVKPGAELVWCYGGTYKRGYDLGRACDAVSFSKTMGDVEGEQQ